MFCMNCGAKLQEGTKFCMNCGMAIGENKSNETKLVPAKCTNCNAPLEVCLLYTSPSPRDRTRSRMPSSA